MAADFGLERGKRVLVTGAAGGIGRATVSALLAAGAEVVGLDLPAVLNAHPLPGEVWSLPCDLADSAALEAAFTAVQRQWGGLDGLVTLAGFARPKAALEAVEPADWRAVIEGNLDTSYLALRAALPLLRKGRAPAIVTMASGLAMKPAPGYGGYGVAKAGIVALTKLVAAEEAPLIRANAVAPSAVDTPFLRGGIAQTGPEAAVRLDVENYLKTVPLGRLARPEEVAEPILFLLSPAARYITGQVLHINGGSLMA